MKTCSRAGEEVKAAAKVCCTTKPVQGLAGTAAERVSSSHEQAKQEGVVSQEVGQR